MRCPLEGFVGLFSDQIVCLNKRKNISFLLKFAHLMNIFSVQLELLD